MDKKAPPILLLLPITLVIVIIALIVLILTSLNVPPTVVTDKNVNTNSTQTNTQNNNGTNNTNNTDVPETSTQGNSLETDMFNKAIGSVPKRGFTDNTCPSYLVLESNGNKFAIQGEDKFTITATQTTWIQANCSDVKTLNY